MTAIVNPTNHWTPLGAQIAETARTHGGLQAIVSPFITTDAVERLISESGDTTDLDVICRWSRKDIATGIADLTLYGFLKARDIPLYIHERIHLKLYVFSDGTGVVTSGNATNKGLGYAAVPNLEMGCTTTLATDDFIHLHSILSGSIKVTDAIHARLLEYQAANQNKDADTLPPLDLPVETQSGLSTNSLPATPSPTQFLRWHADPRTVPPGWTAAYAHDVCTYNMNTSTSLSSTEADLALEFANNELIKRIIEEVRSAGSAPFGQVKEWIQTHCSDTPQPYRWELTEQTSVLYDWLQELIPELHWDRPNHSQVLYWTGK